VRVGCTSADLSADVKGDWFRFPLDRVFSGAQRAYRLLSSGRALVRMDTRGVERDELSSRAAHISRANVALTSWRVDGMCSSRRALRRTLLSLRESYSSSYSNSNVLTADDEYEYDDEYDCRS